MRKEIIVRNYKIIHFMTQMLISLQSAVSAFQTFAAKQELLRFPAHSLVNTNLEYHGLIKLQQLSLAVTNHLLSY